MKRILFIFLCTFLFIGNTFAQGPKWVTKAKKAVFSIITFDKENNILQRSNGFFISEDGVGVSDYQVFNGAHRAVIIDTNGKERPVYSILGADDTYNVIKFKVDMSGKRTAKLDIYSTEINVGTEVVVLPYSLSKDQACRPGVVRSVENIRDGFKFYSLDMRLSDDLISCPLMTTSGEVVGIMEKSEGRSISDMLAHAVDVKFIDNLSINAMSFDDATLNAVHIRKGVPADLGQALAYVLMMKDKLSKKDYSDLLVDFQAQFPMSADGYFNRAYYFLENEKVSEDDLKQASLEISKALSLKDPSSDVYFSAAKLIILASGLDIAKDKKGWKIEEAMELLDKAIELDPLPLYYQIKGDVYSALEDWGNALACYEKVNASNLASAQTFFVTAQLQERNGSSYDVVLASLDSCLERVTKPYDVNSAVYLIERARVREELGKFRDAVFDMNDYYFAVNGQVNDGFFYYREQIAVKAKMYQQALDDIATALKMNPDEMTYYSESAALHLKIGRYKEAIEIADAMLSKDKLFAEAYRLKGIAQMQLKDKNSCDSFKKAQELGDPYVEELIKKACK